MSRTPRTSETRSATVRTADTRKMPTVTDTSPLWIDRTQIPDDLEYFWARESCLGMLDDSRMTELLMSGWEPVPADRHPKWAAPALPGRKAPEDGLIRRGGLILMQIPKHVWEARREEQRREALDQIQGVMWAQEGLGEDVRFVDRNETSIERVRTFKEG